MWTILKVFIEFATALLLFYVFWFFGPKACDTLAPQPGIEPSPSVLEGEIINTGPAEKYPSTSLLLCSFNFYCMHHPVTFYMAYCPSPTLLPLEWRLHQKRDLYFVPYDAKAEAPVLWPPHAKSWLIGKDSDAGRDWGQEEKGTSEDEMAGWHHGHDGRVGCFLVFLLLPPTTTWSETGRHRSLESNKSHSPRWNKGLWFSSKEFVYNAGDEGSIPGLGRSSGEGNGNPLQHSCLGNPMDIGAW